MGGGGSSQQEYNNVNLDKGGLDEFSKTQEGQTWGPWISKLKAGQVQTHYNDPNTFLIRDNSSDTGYSNVSPLISDYNNWIAAQAASNKQYAQYKTLAQDEQGRDSTILTGPAAQSTILGR